MLIPSSASAYLKNQFIGSFVNEANPSNWDLSFAKILSQRLDDDPATCQPGRQCPSYSPCWARCVRRSEPALTLRSKIWRCDNNSSCFAARSARNLGASTASSGCGSPTNGPG